MKSIPPQAGWFSLRVETVGQDSADRAVVHIGISKRIAPLATRRNRVRRLIREALRRRIRTRPGNVYRIRVDRRPGDWTYAQVEAALVQLFK